MPRWLLIVGILVLMPLLRALAREEEAGMQRAAGSPEPTPTVAAGDLPVYKPPPRGAPARTVGGGTRGTRTAVIVLSVLAPDHVGLTTRAQPRLYWYLSAAAGEKVEFVLSDGRRPEPVLETRVPAGEPGIRRIDLADHRISLEPGVIYEWSVAIVPNPKDRSKDVITTGAIQRVETPRAVATRLEGASKSKDVVAKAYAEAGLWYDALDAVSESIAASPGDGRYSRQRAALLEQVGLEEIARADLESATKSRVHH